MMIEPLDENGQTAWGRWYAEHGTHSAGVFFEDGFHIPSMLDSLRFSAFKEGGVEGMREFDRRMAEAWHEDLQLDPERL